MPWREQFDNDDAFQRALRDWFAGQALAAIIQAQEAGGSLPKMMDVTQGVRAGGHEARTAYRYADAMLAARAAEKEEAA